MWCCMWRGVSVCVYVCTSCRIITSRVESRMSCCFLSFLFSFASKCPIELYDVAPQHSTESPRWYFSFIEKEEEEEEEEGETAETAERPECRGGKKGRKKDCCCCCCCCSNSSLSLQVIHVHLLSFPALFWALVSRYDELRLVWVVRWSDGGSKWTNMKEQEQMICRVGRLQASEQSQCHEETKNNKKEEKEM